MNNETVSEISTSKPVMTYDEKMAFLVSIRKECGLDKTPTDNYTEESAPGKYVMEYTFGTI